MATQMTLMKALRDHGLLKGTPGDQIKDIKALTPADREWFAQRFLIEHGIEIVAPSNA